MSNLQPLYRSGTRSNATARRLIANTSIAPHILVSTMEVDLQGREVRGATATQPLQVGRLCIEIGQHFWMIQSKFGGRAYIVTDDYRCSATDERVAEKCCDQVREYRFQASLKKVA